MTASRYVEAPNFSQAWLEAVRLVHAIPSRKAVHLVLRAADASQQDEAVRRIAQAAIDSNNSAGRLWSVESTRNTIFPAAWARRNPEPSDLAAYYRARYKELRQVRDNGYGTYFGRIVAYPRDDKHNGAYGDQLTELVRKIRQELAGRGGVKSSRYEVNIFSERHDTNPMSFPCLAHVSFHIHDGKLHQQAVYRNELLVARAYGNYWGLAQLQTYVAQACPPLQVGELLITVNHVELDGRKGAIDELLPPAR
ncbi:MAG: hypothetical protein ACJ71T_15615 [Actinomycetales bacterium]